MNKSSFVSLSLLALSAAAWAAPAPQDGAAKGGPAVRVRTDAPLPADTSDGRVRVGGVKISMPGSFVAQRTDGVIEVPGNTLGPGLARWQINDRLAAEQKLADAQAFYATNLAEVPVPIYDSQYFYPSTGYGFFNGAFAPAGWIGGGGGGLLQPGLVPPAPRPPAAGPARDGPRDGPRPGARGRADQPDGLHDTAIRLFSRAAYPTQIIAPQESRDSFVREFGRTAQPNIIKASIESQQRATLDAARPAAPAPALSESASRPAAPAQTRPRSQRQPSRH